MSFLKKKITRPMAVAITVIVCVGTAAGAFVWISNLIEKDITVNEMPITFVENSMSETNVDEEILWRLDYTINDSGNCSGYIWIEISSDSAFSTSDANVTDIYILTNGGTELDGKIVSGYPNVVASNVIEYVFEDIYGGTIDFSNSGYATGGQLQIALLFHVAQNFHLSFRVTSSL